MLSLPTGGRCSPAVSAPWQLFLRGRFPPGTSLLSRSKTLRRSRTASFPPGGRGSGLWRVYSPPHTRLLGQALLSTAVLVQVISSVSIPGFPVTAAISGRGPPRLCGGCPAARTPLSHLQGGSLQEAPQLQPAEPGHTSTRSAGGRGECSDTAGHFGYVALVILMTTPI